MKICVQVAVNLTPAECWARFVEDLPPENRHIGPVDLPTSTAPTGDSGEGPGAPSFPFTLAITRWDEGRAIAARMNGPWFLREIEMGMTLDADDAGWARVRGMARLHTPFDLLLRFNYWLFRRWANRHIIRALAEMRHAIETGEEVTDDNRAAVRLDGIRIVRCTRQFRPA